MINFDEGYSFGIGAFETILVNKGECIFLHEHLERLNKALKFLDINKSISKSEVMNYIDENNIENNAIKIIVSSDNTIYTIRDNPYTSETYKKGFSVISSKIRVNETSPFTFIKSLNYGINIIEKRRVSLIGYDEALFLNTKEEICECSTSNIFFVNNNQIITPKRECGLLDGVVRRYILSEYNVKEKIIKLGDIDSFSEAFLTNSLMGILPVSSIDGHCFHTNNKAERLMEEYSRKFKINRL